MCLARRTSVYVGFEFFPTSLWWCTIHCACSLHKTPPELPGWLCRAGYQAGSRTTTRRPCDAYCWVSNVLISPAMAIASWFLVFNKHRKTHYLKLQTRPPLLLVVYGEKLAACISCISLPQSPPLPSLPHSVAALMYRFSRHVGFERFFGKRVTSRQGPDEQAGMVPRVLPFVDLENHNLLLVGDHWNENQHATVLFKCVTWTWLSLFVLRTKVSLVLCFMNTLSTMILMPDEFMRINLDSHKLRQICTPAVSILCK